MKQYEMSHCNYLDIKEKIVNQMSITSELIKKEIEEKLEKVSESTLNNGRHQNLLDIKELLPNFIEMEQRHSSIQKRIIQSSPARRQNSIQRESLGLFVKSDSEVNSFQNIRLQVNLFLSLSFYVNKIP